MKTSSPNRIGIGLLAGALVAVPLAAEDIPLRNWMVPSSVPGGLGKQVDATPPRPFIGLPPCRVIDTRGGAPLGGGGILTNSEARNFAVTGICGIPAGTDAISANFTVTGSPAAPPGAFILAYPTGSPPSPIVSLLNFQAGQTIANAGIVPLNGSGSLTINVSHSTHVIMDVNGYFSDVQGTPANFFRLEGNVSDPGAVIRGENSGSGVGVEGVSFGTGIFSAGVRGTHAGAGIGVYGEALATSGGNTVGIYGITRSSSSSIGVRGVAAALTGRIYGVFGQTESVDLGAAGVGGVDGTGTAAPASFPSAGVRGESQFAFGVLGVTSTSGDAGVTGILASGSGGGVSAQGSLARNTGGTDYGVFSFGDYGGTGAKYFVEPHPRQADMVIRYVALEGPESGTYFRGRAKFQNGVATIQVPEDFRMVTDAEGLSVQITPIGGMASVGVLRVGLDVIVVQGSRNLEFFYTVNGVRKSHKHLRPVVSGQEYMPDSADARMPAYLTEVQKQSLIDNGTYKADGTVNLETAKALGWAKVWKKRAKRSGAETSGGLR